MTQKTLEETLIELNERAKQGPVSLRELLSLFSGKGKALLIVFLILPFCLPIQIPGVSLVFGLLIAFLGLRIAFSKRFWVPQRLLAHQIAPERLMKWLKRCLHIIGKMKRWVYPRFLWTTNSFAMRILNGLIIGLLGILLALPFPIPLTNLMAAWPIFFLSFGLVEDDGLFMVIGYTLFLIAIFFFTGLFMSLQEIVS